MKEFLNDILVFLGMSTITTQEESFIDDSIAPGYTIETYEMLKSILSDRQSANDEFKKLAYFYKAKGVSISKEAYIPSSNIFIGAKL